MRKRKRIVAIDNLHLTRHNAAVPFFRSASLSLLLSSLIAVVPVDALAQGCAMCQSVMPKGDDPLARGLFWSVLLLMSMPFIVGGSIGGWLYYRYRHVHSAPKIAAPVFPLPVALIQKEE